MDANTLSAALDAVRLVRKKKIMSKSFQQLIEEITGWQDSVFTRATPLSAVTHLQREAIELTFAIQTKHLKRENGDSDIQAELADCFLLIIGVAHLSGIDLEQAVEEKMAINRRRVWGEPDSDGVVEHVRDTLVEVFKDEGLSEDFENLFKDL